MLRAAEFYFDGKIDTGCRAAAMTPGCDPSGIQDSWTFVFANCSATGLKALCPMATAIINSTSDFTAPCSSCVVRPQYGATRRFPLAEPEKIHSVALSLGLRSRSCPLRRRLHVKSASRVRPLLLRTNDYN